MWTLPAGRILGIPIRIHLTWLLLVFFGISTLQPQFAERSTSDSWAYAFIATLCVLLSIVLHEIGHAVVAQRKKMHVDSITLYLTGGYTEIREDLKRPSDEFQIALAGPFVSMLLLLGALGLYWFSIGALSYIWHIVAIFNGILLVFNLLPFYPLDGGRAVRAIFWFLHDDLLQGTALSMQLTRVLGNITILIGAVVLVTGDPLSGFLAMGLGWMATRAALSSYLQTALHYTLSKISVRELMSGSFRTVSPYMTLDLFVGQFLLGQTEQGFAVVQAERVVGLITVRNLRRFSPQKWQETMVQEAMIPQTALPVIHPEDSAQIAYQALIDKRFDQLPVTLDGELLGMIRYRDVASFVQTNLKRPTRKKR